MTHPLSRPHVEQILDRIQQQKGVTGLIIVNQDGMPIRSTLDNSSTLQYVNMCKTMCGIARSVVRDTDPTNDLKILRVRTRKHEVIMAPENGQYLIVIQADGSPQQTGPMGSLLD
ncbi:predicted protein [Nematostella vectensis]|uniref:Roadblock/LAMTOR2 domain-containing protein n=1 Tax=Nematostella vectensis TaxID=45351 RepID=A7S187_NEMVE|nr:predicted protein [Nematostella vectensis]|eukprot:XP_001634618.1 predicted protein [Nematostella vectensis]